MRQHIVPVRKLRQTGVAAVEFAIVAVIFLTFVFGLLEVIRVMYVINTLQEVTRRAASGAAITDFHDDSALTRIRANAVFRDTPGPLLLADPITDANVTIEYLSVSKGSDGSMSLKPITSLPSCPARNRLNCLSDPYGGSCIRAVRARVCASSDTSGGCTPVGYKSLFSIIGLGPAISELLTAPTIVPAGSLGYNVGSMPCS
jgi:hypothetical protein